ncbi:hypothetical protein [Pseudoduganella sp. RAF53_2]|uniref:hypothetical protein n=1 Tax=unclassified Pseudoduganella TaxID=2637179 RepID=UPI003F9E5A68
MKTIAAIVLGLAVCTTAVAQEKRIYKEGTVTSVSFIRTKPGHFDDYMKFLLGPYKAVMEAQKKAGLVVDHRIYAANPKNPHEPDVILTVTYANMAALDRSDEADAVSSKVAGSFEAQDKAYADREAIREVLGSELIRELHAR